MKNQKVTQVEIGLLEQFKAARDKKNEGTREEKNSRKVLDVSLPALMQKQEEYCFTFREKPVAIWKQGTRQSLDQSKLQREFPEAYAACYLPSEVWTLDVLL